jgi:hypothetical protein
MPLPSEAHFQRFEGSEHQLQSGGQDGGEVGLKRVDGGRSTSPNAALPQYQALTSMGQGVG